MYGFLFSSSRGRSYDGDSRKNHTTFCWTNIKQLFLARGAFLKRIAINHYHFGVSHFIPAKRILHLKEVLRAQRQHGAEILELVSGGRLFAIEHVRIVLADVAFVIVYQLFAWVSHIQKHNTNKSKSFRSFVVVACLQSMNRGDRVHNLRLWLSSSACVWRTPTTDIVCTQFLTIERAII